ncbi:hypothetical protein [Rivularia sp. UHCC 0363]|uniref:hypothetical protein n=1 Tax=Rivularia sp. UHCC 0363 TaxID=3110244 RepID=UPI002B1F8D65|nr:hypothetical protein [Rivularia sp. UHCC 0363]MEA5594020.1 hypothetical protein [Rivularia sp. UHCC 0363]
MNKRFLQQLILITIFISFLGFITVMAMGTLNHNPFPKQDGNLIAELEFKDGQMGFVGISGTSWTILPDGTSRANRFVNDTVSSAYKTCLLDKRELASIAKVLSDVNFAELPPDIPSEPTINPHLLTVRVGEKSSTLQLQAGETIENALKTEQNKQETPRWKFLTVAGEINQLIRKNCGDY